LASDLNAKHPFWNSAVSNHSDEELMALFVFSEFEISASQCPTHYSPAGNGSARYCGSPTYQSVRFTVSHIFDSDHLPIIFHILDHFKIRNLSEYIEKFTNCYRFQSPASELISSRIEINSGVETDTVSRDFIASIASVNRLVTGKFTRSNINNDIPRLDLLLKQKQRIRKLWQETRDPACKTIVKGIKKLIRRMSRK
jgi:hypothetical protein